MADMHVSNAPLPPVTEDALLADRQRFWHSFNNFTVAGIIGVLCVLLLALYFIL
jgi:hypothetical protein